MAKQRSVRFPGVARAATILIAAAIGVWLASGGLPDMLAAQPPAVQATGTPDLAGAWDITAVVIAGPSTGGVVPCTANVTQSGNTLGGTITCYPQGTASLSGSVDSSG